MLRIRLAVYISVISLCLTSVIPAEASKPHAAGLLKAIAEADFGGTYYDEGAADGSVTCKGQILGSGPNLIPDPRVRAVVDLRHRAIPLLIRHLDDTRPTRISFRGKPVPLGHIALDMLINIIVLTDKAFIPDCADDGLGACFEPGYYFRPDASPDDMKPVKRRWQQLYRSGILVFQYPKWWQ